MKKVFIETYGCQMNVYDTELIRGILAQHGDVAFVDDEASADVVLLNTCAIRENAHVKVYNRLEQLKPRKRKGKLKAIGILGCMAQSLRKSLPDDEPMVDIFAGPDAYKRLPSMLELAVGEDAQATDFSLSEYETYSDVAPSRIPGVNAWIAIMRGCDNFCTFCVVPYTRGRERSRTLQSVVDEAREAVQSGYKQITLLGQNVNSYRTEGHDFADLMAALGELRGLERVRFTSPHPKDFPLRLLEVMGRYENLCKHIHLPLQSGSDSVLERMNRTYTREEYLSLVAQIRATLPGVSLTTDAICGFCGESEADFDETYQVMQQVGFDAAFIFKYSERNQTVASRKYADDVPEGIKTERVMRLNALQRRVSLARNRLEIGTEHRVLVERASKKNEHDWFARADHFKGVVFSSHDAQPGDIVRVRIDEAYSNTLRGTELPG
ncbi:MAG: tRNA (N6-isopentenyl adenosine(37)-C2)-methylthiotransferase MiaB [Myxococcales bacterium]|nr:tRNA (N6-isopentenyl adenosine(37)-C2)-methylthiotransferase MiaB [Myxococcales bacterium]